MATPRISLLISLAGLAACSGNPPDCAREERKDLATIEALMEESRTNLQRGVVGIDHRICKAAGAGDDGHAAIAQADQLREAAWLEPRWDQNGIGAALNEVAERFVIATDDADLAWMPVLRAGKGVFDPLLTRSQHAKLRTHLQQRI